MQTQVVIDMIETFLPPIERAIELTDTFLEHLSWMFHIVSRQLVVGELIPTIYKLNHNTYGPHDLALMLITLGIGALVDLNLPPYNLEAQHYYRLACAALGLQPVLAQQSIVTIKTLHLISIYNGMSGKESNLEQSYMMLSLAGRLALGVSLLQNSLLRTYSRDLPQDWISYVAVVPRGIAVNFVFPRCRPFFLGISR